jgi:hypothetical protein
MSEIQGSILSMSFNQLLPKTISDKVFVQITLLKDDKDKDQGNGGHGQGKFKGKRFPGTNKDNQDKSDLVYNNDKSHQNWHLQENENFGRVFYGHQKEAPKISDGKLICMKFFL